MSSIARYEFGPFVLDVIRRSLEKGGERIEIAPKAFDLLLALVEKPGRVVSKKEILERVWPDTFVEQSNIAQNISLARKALGDSTDEPQVIITVPRQGYQFAMPVRAVAPNARPENVPHADSGGLNTLAVFPFTSVAEEELDGVLDNLFAEAVADSLRKIPLLFVQTYPSALALRDGVQTTDIDRARAMGVDAFIVGFHRRSGTSWHVAIQLFRVHDGAIAWSTSVRGEFSTVSDVKDAVANEVLAGMQQLSRHIRSAPPSFAESRNRDAFKHYLRGRHFWNKRTAEALKEAFDCAVRAVEIDPTYIRGHLGIADTYALMGGQHAVLAPAQAFPRARAAAHRALEIDENCGEAYASLGFVNSWYDWDEAEADRNFARAVDLKPTYATGYHWWAEALACLGRFAESIAHFETAVVLDPLSSAIRVDFAAALSLAGDFRRCELILRDVLQLDPGFARALSTAAINCERMGDYAGAREYVARALAAEPHSPSLLALEARALAGDRLRDQALATIHRIEALQATNNVVCAELASAYAALNEFDRAEELIVRAFERREAHLAWMLGDSRFDTLRAETDLTRHWTSQRIARV